MNAKSKHPASKKGGSRSLFYRISAWLHLWLGLVSGIIVVIICITGCIYVFNEEITAWLEPESNIPVQQQALIPPSKILEIAGKEYPGKQVGYVMYREGRAIEANIGGRRGGSTLKLNPYTGEVIKKINRKEGEVSFFRWILNGHRFLWLPFKIGRPIINYSTLVFVITLISGLVLWWPRKWTKATRKQSFSIKWNGNAKRVNYDLHNVVGFYALLLLFAIAVTGMVYGIEWWSKGLYWATSGGNTLPPYKEAMSDSTQLGKHQLGSMGQKVDISWQKVISENPAASGFYVAFPDTAKPKSGISIIAYPSKGQYYNNKRYAFDQHTLERLKGNRLYEQDYAEADFAGKLRRMNYDIHVGSILGLPGKFLAFFASLIGATLPVTGFIIWWGKGRKKKKPAAPVRKAAVSTL
ncbi:putative iron-regulated membrane protein [Chitinophaga terrae (ex Kim and Jung 2007)]|uniref:PepSY-associated TM helix domain-containing protein n=1 Tax=Chitinophaga terrae (ex Kim and Jung 2007) TaxID=408074 RepID=UPI0027860409|nr:PepSY-associated TM helix domain-containing protein [Chitinophaga terrae (ex Kim and Jung 2007)]MDQ0109455.1 putative iron-regulated membrane protein [Chitinophaga terrae (ex Kim and Jung 2007)]